MSFNTDPTSLSKQTATAPNPDPFPSRQRSRAPARTTGKLRQGAKVTWEQTHTEVEIKAKRAIDSLPEENVPRQKRKKCYQIEEVSPLAQLSITAALPILAGANSLISPDDATATPSFQDEDLFFSPTQPPENFKLARRRGLAELPLRAGPQIRFKRAQIINLPTEDFSLTIKNLVINGEYYPIQLINEGNFHNVYQFITDKPLTLNGNEIPVREVIIKTLKSTLGPKTEEAQYKMDLQAVADAREAGVPFPHIWVRPDQFQDALDPKNGFWIIEKMTAAVSPDDEDAFEFAKTWLQRSVEKGKELINDLYPRNLMRDKEGMIRVVDCGVSELMEKEGWISDFTMNLASYLFHWSSNGDQSKLDSLMELYPQELKKSLLTGIEERRNEK